MKNKKFFYLSASIFLGWLLALLGHSLLEIYFIDKALNQNLIPVNKSLWGENCYLPFYIDILLYLFGLGGGYFWGKYWWQRLYVKNKLNNN